ncbi:hypothetical protein PsorP6_015691 [Peronosclerospora sorghi]|uniref:Uncharacterized protein n=1 Tax=Peronosclerospora sorghi TaxID=230839 RepID=A0ACC0WPP2_9STRA|nr:hypothetical protein PsorP6_015691 [Peronosclerospora sorghi]
MEATEKQKLLQCQADSAVQQMKSRRLEEVLEEKTALVEHNSLSHSQLEHAAAQVRRAHEQELLKGMESRANPEAGEGSSGSDVHAKEVDELRRVIAYLRRENEIAEANLELAQKEVQRGRA